MLALLQAEQGLNLSHFIWKIVRPGFLCILWLACLPRLACLACPELRIDDRMVWLRGGRRLLF
jgi:hypothetical protein